MSTCKLIYFEGCPNAKHARAVLLTSGLEFEVVKQDDITDENPLKNYSSPTILKDDLIIFGQRLDPGASACSFEKFDENMIRKKLAGKIVDSSKGRLAAFGSFGSAFTVGLCPVCIPAIGGFLSSIGLGFLVTESVLLPLLIIFLVLTIGGLLWSYLKIHRKLGPLIGGIIMGTALYIGRYVYINGTVNSILMYGGIAGIVAVTFWNIKLRKAENCSACEVPN